MGLLSKFMDSATFNSLLPKVMKAIEHVLSDPDAKQEDRLPVTENAIISLGFIALVHTKDAVQINKFLDRLPLEGDDEAQEAHEYLAEQVLVGN